MSENYSTPEKRPLVTFALFAYNQEKFIREAVDGAFSQTYSPLEIILSDDCSADRTFEIMKEMATHYQGPHRIVLNKNSKNVGLANHINNVADLTNGEWIVMAAGDDVSLSERVEKLIECLNESKASCVFSDLLNMDVSGNVNGFYFGVNQPAPPTLQTILKSCSCWVLGGSSCYSVKLLKEFPRIDERVICEDNVLPFRACLAQGVVYLDKVLVRYRSHADNLFNVDLKSRSQSSSLVRQKKVRDYEQKLIIVEQWVTDCESILGIDSEFLEKIKRLCQIVDVETQWFISPKLSLAIKRIKLGPYSLSERDGSRVKFWYRKMRIETFIKVFRSLLFRV
jgi:glycosyltransferase involved in cell wall biosynthesis